MKDIAAHSVSLCTLGSAGRDTKYKSIQLILHAFKLYCELILFLSIILIIAGYNKHVQYEAKPFPRPLLSDQGWIQGTITLTFRDLNDEQ